MLLFLEKKMAGKTLESVMNSEGTMGMLIEQDISTNHPALMSFLIKQKLIVRVDNVALCILDYIGNHRLRYLRL